MTACIVVAAGKGTRFKSKMPKVFYLLNGRPVLEYSLMKISECPAVDEIVLVMQKKYIRHRYVSRWKRLFPKIKAVVPGGRFREMSVLKGFLKCSKNSDTILVHDGARPFVSIKLIKKITEGVLKYGSCIPVYPANGSVKVVKNGKLISTILEKNIGIAQTPQGFRRDILEKAFHINRRHLKDFPDEASMLEKSGYSVYTVSGEITNIKITTRDDLKIARVLSMSGC